jgi:hypothetical protein
MVARNEGKIFRFYNSDAFRTSGTDYFQAQRYAALPPYIAASPLPAAYRGFLPEESGGLSG